MSSNCTNDLQNIKLRWRNIIEYMIKIRRGPMELCRICLNNTTDFVKINSWIHFNNIWIIDGGSIIVKTLLNAVLPQIDLKQKHLPQHICKHCLKKTINAYILIKQHQTSNMMIKECVDNLSELIINLQNDNCKALKLMCKYSMIDNFLPDNIVSPQDLPLSDIETKYLVSNRLVKKRYSNKNKTTNTYECTMCSEDHSNKNKLIEHVQTHPSNTTHICRECGNIFKKIIDLRVHIRRHRDTKEKLQILCPKCGKIFTSQLKLKRHFVCHKEYTITCDICKKKFKTKSLLRAHILNNHETKTNAICHICGKVFTNIASMKSHLNCHRTRKCTYCNKFLKTHVNYDYHIKKHETGIGRKNINRTIYKCNDCNYKSCNKTTLEGHMNKKHLNIRPYICGYLKCEKSFFTKGNLQEHTRFVHMHVKIETCSQCGATFANLKCLKRHMRLHTAERPYTCDLCEKTFISTSRRNEHKKRTHGNYKELCTYCDKKFAFKAALNRHVRETHTKKIENAPK